MLTTLKIFLDVVDERSFTRAASMNYLTPSAVSQRIQLLEDHVGQPLLIRDRKGVVATEAGLIFYKACRDVLDRFEQARQDMGSLAGTVETTLSNAGTCSGSKSWPMGGARQP